MGEAFPAGGDSSSAACRPFDALGPTGGASKKLLVGERSERIEGSELLNKVRPGFVEASFQAGTKPGRAATIGPLTPACARLKGGRRLVTAAVFVGYKRRPPPRAGGQREAKRSVGRRQEAVAIKRRL